jgi:hypothetical protein
MGMHDLRLDAVLRQHGARGEADVGIVVIVEAGRVDHRLATKARRVAVDDRGGGARLAGERRAGVDRQFGARIKIRDLLKHAAGELVLRARRPIRDRRHDARELAVAIGFGEFAVNEGPLALLLLERAITQHQMREVEIELVRRHIRALRHEAHVAERAGVDDGLEILAGDGVELARLRLIDQIEELGERVAQIEAAAAAVADVEDATQLFVELRLIVELGIVPVERMPNGRFETTLSHSVLVAFSDAGGRRKRKRPGR